MYKLVFIIFFLIANSYAIDDTLNNWISNKGSSIDIQDIHFRKLCKQIAPDNWIDDIYDRLTNGHSATTIQNRYIFLEACKFHSCNEKLVLWYDTQLKNGMIVIIDAAYPENSLSSVYYTSKTMSISDISPLFFENFKEWLLKQEIKNYKEEYVMKDKNDTERTKIETTNKKLSNSYSEKIIDSIPKIQLAYSHALIAFKKNNISECIEILEQSPIKYFTSNCNCGNQSATSDIKKLIPILNDYAFFLYKKYQYDINIYCKQLQTSNEAEERPLSQAIAGSKATNLEKAKYVLECIMSIDSTRAVAYLNIADVLYNLSEEKDAQKFYEKYVNLMISQGKENKIPEYAKNPALRKVLDECE